MAIGDEILERLAPADGWVADWPDVLVRAQDWHVRQGVTKRRLILTVAAAVGVLVPLAALAAAGDWWFLESNQTPVPASTPVIVKEGQWGGHAWQLVAFPSTTDGLCVAVTPKGSAGPEDGAAMGCDAFEGVTRTSETKNNQNLKITYISGSETGDLPAYIVGPVIESAATVEIHFDNGETLRLATSPGPPPLDQIRFYAAPLPTGVEPTQIQWLAGIDEKNDVVACLALDRENQATCG